MIAPGSARGSRPTGRTSPPTYDVDAVQLGNDLTLLDAESLQLTATSTERNPSIAAADDVFLMVWQRQADDTIRARRIGRFGAPSEQVVVTHGRAPSVVRRGGAYVIAFEDEGDLFATTLGTPRRRAIRQDEPLSDAATRSPPSSNLCRPPARIDGGRSRGPISWRSWSRD